ncbi:LysR family transcriptional regulator [Rosenbergiella collisarenosi]|uniref:LysR family transcriptional regulator n=1 Tax=Rosenbergiella collisarenosi TaxID=1544695 RepID=UPI001BDB467B|nr:LysR family transcriptional regulator [Rosenbergiella collisarenosi]MBT0720840.1 LysR family transcriptional regulator [Rosenbergiella collisarenosi]
MKNELRNLDLNLLKAFGALLDERSVTRAAHRLAITQPAVSGMLVKLREYFNDPLFVRTPDGMMPTVRAEELTGPVTQILRDITQLLHSPHFDPNSATLTFKFAATDYALSAVLIPLIALLKSRAPGINIAVQSVSDDRVAQQLSRGEVDLALLTPETTAIELHSRSLYQEEYVCVVHRSHPAAQSLSMTIEQFCDYEHVLVSTEGKFSGPTDEKLAEMNLNRRVGVSVNSFHAVPEILRLTAMIAVLPRRLATVTHDLVIIPMPLTVPGFTKSMAWHARRHHDPAHRWLRALCIEVSQ